MTIFFINRFLLVFDIACVLINFRLYKLKTFDRNLYLLWIYNVFVEVLTVQSLNKNMYLSVSKSNIISINENFNMIKEV